MQQLCLDSLQAFVPSIQDRHFFSFALTSAIPRKSIGQIEQTKHFPVSNFDVASKLIRNAFHI